MNHTNSDSTADACFALEGSQIPIDHGYLLFAALSRLVPELHSNSRIGLHTIAGRQKGPGVLDLEGKSVLRLRVPAKEVGILFPLVGAQIQLAGESLSLGELTLKPLLPKPALWAKFVTLKGHTQAQSFHDKLREQLCAIDRLGQDPAQIELLIAHRKVMRIHDKKVVGFRVIAQGLNAQASIRLQEVGLGGRRHMGAGLFIPKNK